MSKHVLVLPDGSYRYRLHHAQGLSGYLTLHANQRTQHFIEIGSSQFFLSADNRWLFKFSPSKYSPHQRWFKWMLRDVLSTRLMGKYDARREYKSARVLARLGQQTVRCYGYGMPTRLANPLGSLYVMEYMGDAVSGREHMARLDEDSREHFFDRVMEWVIALARAGYAHRDLHLGNLMVTAQEDLVWIDTHVRRLPRQRARRAHALTRMIDAEKLGGTDFAERAMSRLRCALPELFSTSERQA